MIQTHLEAWWFEAKCKNVWEGRDRGGCRRRLVHREEANRLKAGIRVTQRTFGGVQMRNWEGRIKTQVREMKNRQPRVGDNVGSMKGQTQQMK